MKLCDHVSLTLSRAECNLTASFPISLTLPARASCFLSLYQHSFGPRPADRHENKAHAQSPVSSRAIHSASISSPARLLHSRLSRRATAPFARSAQAHESGQSPLCSFPSLPPILSSRLACCTIPAVTHGCHAEAANLQPSVRGAHLDKSTRYPLKVLHLFHSFTCTAGLCT